MKPDLSKTQLVKNLASNLAAFGLGIVSNLVLTPYWIRKFGVAAYGLVPLTNNLVAYLGLITTVLSASVGRFITVEVGRGDLARAHRTFNTSLWGSVVLAVIAFAFGGLASFRADSLLAVPEGLGADARLMMQLATLTFVVTLLQTPFGAAAYCVNRLDLNNWVGLAMRLVQILIGVGLVATIYCRPSALMIASLAGTAVGAAAAIAFWRRFMPWARITPMVDRAILKEQLAFGGWSVINLVGSLLYLQIDLIVINRMLGPVPGGQYAALAQWSMLIRGLGGAVSSILGPTIVHYFARQEIDQLSLYARRSVLAMGLFLALPIGIVAGLARPLLTVWLGPSFAGLGWLLLLMILPLCVNVAVTPLFMVQSAANKVKVPALVTCAMGVGNVVLAISLTRAFGMYGVAAAGALMLTAKNVVFTPVYAAWTLERESTTFFGEIMRTAILSVAIAAVAYAFSRVVTLDSWLRLATAAIAMAAFYAPVAWRVVLSADERRAVMDSVISPARARLGALLS